MMKSGTVRWGKMVEKVLEEEAGQGMVEYALIIMLVILGAAVSLRGVAPWVERMYVKAAEEFERHP